MLLIKITINLLYLICIVRYPIIYNGVCLLVMLCPFYLRVGTPDLVLALIKIKEKKKVSVQEQCLLLLQILPKFWSRFQLVGLKSTQRHKCFKGARCLWY